MFAIVCHGTARAGWNFTLDGQHVAWCQPVEATLQPKQQRQHFVNGVALLKSWPPH